MKQFAIGISIILLLLVGVTFAQDEASDMSDGSVINIVTLNFDEGEFEDTEQENVYTLILSEPEPETEIIAVLPIFSYQTISTELLSIGIQQIRGELSEIQAILVYEGWQVDLLLNTDDFEYDLEELIFNVEIVGEPLSLFDDGSIFEDNDSFDDVQLILYLDDTNSITLGDSLIDSGGGARSQNSGQCTLLSCNNN